MTVQDSSNVEEELAMGEQRYRGKCSYTLIMGMEMINPTVRDETVSEMCAK